MDKEKELRNGIKNLFEKDQKFINYIPIYIWNKVIKYIKDDNADFKQKKKEIQVRKIYLYQLSSLEIKQIWKT